MFLLPLFEYLELRRDLKAALKSQKPVLLSIVDEGGIIAKVTKVGWGLIRVTALDESETEWQADLNVPIGSINNIVWSSLDRDFARLEHDLMNAEDADDEPLEEEEDEDP